MTWICLLVVLFLIGCGAHQVACWLMEAADKLAQWIDEIGERS